MSLYAVAEFQKYPIYENKRRISMGNQNRIDRENFPRSETLKNASRVCKRKRTNGRKNPLNDSSDLYSVFIQIAGKLRWKFARKQSRQLLSHYHQLQYTYVLKLEVYLRWKHVRTFTPGFIIVNRISKFVIGQ